VLGLFETIARNCAECRNALLAEALSLGGLPLGGEVVMIPRHWLNTVCPHGRLGLKFELEEGDQGVSSRKAEREKAGEVEQDSPNSRMDATKDMGYPVREHGPYGSHPMHDDFDDESGPDGSGTY
jgi:hypothetical protein